MKFRWNLRAFEEIRRSNGVRKRLEKETERIQTALDGEVKDGYASGVESGRTRLRGFAVTATGDAIRYESSSHALLRTLLGGD